MVKKLVLAAAARVTIGALGPATAVARAPAVLSGGLPYRQGGGFP
jgi:hypothetical protein